ncbi:hypothetical protein C5167_044462, partial [Papaver somniferum]
MAQFAKRLLVTLLLFCEMWTFFDGVCMLGCRWIWRAREAAVPPNATLLISLEFLSWKIVTEVTPDKKVIKKVLKEGEGYDKPNDGTVAKVKLTGKLQDGTIFLRTAPFVGIGILEALVAASRMAVA